MSTKLTKQPFELSLSRNPMEVHVQSNNFIESDAIYPTMTLVVDYLDTNDFFKFNITDPESLAKYEIKLTAVDNPDNSGTQFKKYIAFAGGVAAFYYSIERAIQLNSKLMALYTYGRVGNDFIFTAKENVGSFLSFTTNQPTLVSLSTVSLTKDVVYRKNHRVLLEVWFEKEYMSNNFEKVALLEDTVDRYGLATFDISSIIDAELESSSGVNLSDLTADEFYVNDSLRRYDVRYTELYTGNDAITSMNCSAVKLARIGGVSKEDFAKANPILSIQACKQFLTSFDAKKTVHYMQKDWLSWMNYTNKKQAFDLIRTIYYTDGTDSGPIVVESNFTLPKWETVTFPASYPQIPSADINAAKVVFKWTFAIVRSGTSIEESIVQTYYLDNKFEHCKNQFAYINSFNQPEGLLSKGAFEETISISATTIDRTIRDKYLIVNGQQYVFNRENNISYSVTTGFYSQAEIRVLQDMLQSGMLYIIDGLDYYPALIDQGDFKITECFTFLNQLSFKIRKSFKDNSFSNKSRVPYISIPEGCGVRLFNLEHNKVDIATYGPLSVYKQDGTLIETVAYDITDPFYELTDNITAEGTYRYKVSLTGADGKLYSIDVDFEVVHESIIAKTSLVDTVPITLKTNTATDQKIYYNYESGAGVQNIIINNTGVGITGTYTEVGNKSIRISKPCMDDLSEFICSNKTLTNLDLSAAVNLNLLNLTACNLPGSLDLTSNNKINTMDLQSNYLTSIKIPLMRDLQYMNIKNNFLSITAIENLLIQLNTDVTYISNSVYLDISGNPGAGGSLSALASDIINGTGGYPGLISTYNWNIVI